MKPELQALIDSTFQKLKSLNSAEADLEGWAKCFLSSVFEEALYWRGDELWCGPFAVGSIWSSESDGEVFHFGGLGGAGGMYGDWKSETQARAALMSAAQNQINEGFKE